jgi:hypothetical protein
MRNKAIELCGETTFDDLGLRTAGTGNLEEVLVGSGQRVAAVGAAVALVMALSLLRRRGWTYLAM